MIPLYIIYGSLGSGKTTYIQNLLQQEEFKNAYLIENEFAHVNIDAKNLSTNPTIPISGSCVCCSTGDELEQALIQITQQNSSNFPVVLETTGVAEGREVIKKLALMSIFSTHYVLKNVTYILDCLENPTPNLDSLLIADTIYLAKTDLIDIKLATQIQSNLLAQNFSLNSDIQSQALSKLKSTSSQPHPNQTYFVQNLSNTYTPESIQNLVAKLYNQTGLYRVKGFFKSPDQTYYQIQSTPKHTEIKSTNITESLLVFIGPSLDNQKIHDLFSTNS